MVVLVSESYLNECQLPCQGWIESPNLPHYWIDVTVTRSGWRRYIWNTIREEINLKNCWGKKSSSIKHFESGRGQIWSSCSLKVDVELLEHFWQILQNGNNLFLYFSTTKKKSCNLFILELVVQHSHHGCKWRENKRKKEREKNIQTCHNQLQRFFRWAIWVLMIMRGKSKPKRKKRESCSYLSISSGERTETMRLVFHSHPGLNRWFEGWGCAIRRPSESLPFSGNFRWDIRPKKKKKNRITVQFHN